MLEAARWQLVEFFLSGWLLPLFRCPYLFSSRTLSNRPGYSPWPILYLKQFIFPLKVYYEMHCMRLCFWENPIIGSHEGHPWLGPECKSSPFLAEAEMLLAPCPRPAAAFFSGSVSNRQHSRLFSKWVRSVFLNVEPAALKPRDLQSVCFLLSGRKYKMQSGVFYFGGNPKSSNVMGPWIFVGPPSYRVHMF